MLKGIVLKLIAACMLFLLAGCHQADSASLPSSWPIPELTLPPGAKLSGKVIDTNAIGVRNTDPTWTATIDYSQGWDELVKHVETCLKPLNYSEFWSVNPRIGDMRGIQRAYYSPDQLTEVSLMNMSFQSGNTNSTKFIISITLCSAPNTMLKYAGTTSSRGVKHYLEQLK